LIRRGRTHSVSQMGQVWVGEGERCGAWEAAVKGGLDMHQQLCTAEAQRWDMKRTAVGMPYEGGRRAVQDGGRGIREGGVRAGTGPGYYPHANRYADAMKGLSERVKVMQAGLFPWFQQAEGLTLAFQRALTLHLSRHPCEDWGLARVSQKGHKTCKFRSTMLRRLPKWPACSGGGQGRG